jgi:Ala-tRNA(Pro) deacylase
MPVRKLKEFLDGQGVRYVSIGHSPAYTAQEVAASAHISGKAVAKTIIVKLDGKMAMAVLPANKDVGFQALAAATGAKNVALATESEFRSLFGECEPGAMPPFGNLYDMPVFVEEILTRDKEIVFNAGSHRELVKLAYADYDRLVKPKVGRFAR